MDPSTPRGQASSADNIARWMAIAVTTIAAAAYANAIRGEFVFDDIKLIVNNDIVKDPGRAWDLLSTNLWGLLGRGSNYYRPLPPLLFTGLHAAFGVRPEPFHLVNISLHAGTSCLVFLIAHALLATHVSRPQARWSAFIAASLFAVHPIHVEAVAWASGVMDVACGFFSLLAVYLHVTADDRPRRPPRAALSAAALLLALASKEPAAVVPFLVVAYDLLFARQRLTSPRAAALRWTPVFATLAMYLVIRSAVLGGLAPYETATPPIAAVALTIPRLFALYVQKLLVPLDLNVVYDLDPVTSPASLVFLWSMVIVAASAAVAWKAMLVRRTAAFGLLLFAFALAPTLYVPALSQDLSKAFAERYVYLPSAGAAVLLAAALASIGSEQARRRKGAAAVLGLVGVAFVGLTLQRNTVWQSSLTLWADCVQKSPKLALAHESLGLALVRAGRPDEGQRSLRVALQLAPDLARNAVDSGVRAARVGLKLQAILSFQTALLYDPSLVEAHYNLGLAFEQLGWTGPAMQAYGSAVAHDAAHADAHNNLGILLAQQQRLDDAIEHFQAALRTRPRDPDVRLNLARALDMTGRSQQAAEQRALAELTPALPAR